MHGSYGSIISWRLQNKSHFRISEGHKTGRQETKPHKRQCIGVQKTSKGENFYGRTLKVQDNLMNLHPWKSKRITSHRVTKMRWWKVFGKSSPNKCTKKNSLIGMRAWICCFGDFLRILPWVNHHLFFPTTLSLKQIQDTSPQFFMIELPYSKK